MPAFWHWFVAAGTILFVVWCIWLISWSARQGPKNVADEELVGHKWDGDLEEWNNPAPKWWLYLYFITIAWAIGYLIAFPGLGNYAGALGWSQEGQYEAEMQAAAERYEPIYEEFAAMGFAELAKNQEANDLGASLYASYCTSCHGSDARGAKGYPNLTDDDWLWGDSEAAITATLKHGRNGIMPVLAPAMGGEQGIRNMVRYVRSLSGLVQADAAAMSAQPLFVALCSACHMADGSGNQMVGGPNLTDDVWLYGSSEETVYETLVNGRNNVMPAHGELLGEDRTKILAAYVYSLSQQ
ncbi:MAG: cytochrome-c oxidase, cbb3-type subunit III [Gammaproteobacteria bacterium]|nr:cytochrome-c oxidase, cbb3-type subunit III [Gammaproteobacteria bacterium]